MFFIHNNGRLVINLNQIFRISVLEKELSHDFAIVQFGNGYTFGINNEEYQSLMNLIMACNLEGK